MRRTVALLPVVLLALLIAAVYPGGPGARPSAAAHALLVSAEPAVNASVPALPAELLLRFSEPLERRFSSATVTDQDGRRLDTAVAFDAADPNVMRVAVGEAGPGYVVVSWETLSSVDGHRITGSYPITILNPDSSVPAAPPPAAVSAQGEEARPAFVVAKALGLLGGCLLAGALMFRLWVSPRLPQPAARATARHGAVLALAALAVVFLAGLLELLAQAADLNSGLDDVLATRWGERWLLRNACYAVALAAAPALLLRPALPASRGRAFAAAGLLATAGAFVAVSSTSHAAAGEGAFWATLTDFVHLFAASVWLGMLALLALLFAWAGRRLPPPERHAALSTALQRFSVVAVVSVALLLATGTLSAVIEVGRPADLVDTAYGRALLLKLLLLLPLLAIGAYNAYVLRPRYAEQPPLPSSGDRATSPVPERRLLRTIALELAVACLVLAVVAVLVQLTPARAANAPASADPFAETKQAQGIAVALAVAPNLAGINTFDVALSGDVATVEQVRLEFLDRSGATNEARLELTKATPGVYSGQGPFLSRSGDWQIRVNLRQSAGADLSVPFDLRVAGATAAPAGDFASPVDLDEWRALLVALALVAAVTLIAVSLRRTPRSDRRPSGLPEPGTLPGPSPGTRP
jgi:copper transport protein